MSCSIDCKILRICSGDYSKYSKQFECFFYKLAQAYPKIFLMEMYGIQTLWEYIQSYKRESLNGSINIYQAALHIYEIIYYLYQSLPNFVSLDEMPTYKIEKKYAAALAAGVVKANTKKEIVKKTGSVILLAKDIVDGLNANSIKRYYESFKSQLEHEYLLKNHSRCVFEELLLQKCNAEINKCNEGTELSILSGISNVAELLGASKINPQANTPKSCRK